MKVIAASKIGAKLNTAQKKQSSTFLRHWNEEVNEPYRRAFATFVNNAVLAGISLTPANISVFATNFSIGLINGIIRRKPQPMWWRKAVINNSNLTDWKEIEEGGSYQFSSIQPSLITLRHIGDNVIDRTDSTGVLQVYERFELRISRPGQYVGPSGRLSFPIPFLSILSDLRVFLGLNYTPTALFWITFNKFNLLEDLDVSIDARPPIISLNNPTAAIETSTVFLFPSRANTLIFDVAFQDPTGVAENSSFSVTINYFVDVIVPTEVYALYK